MITLLANRGADLTAESDYGTPMVVAIHWNKPESVRALSAVGVPMSTEQTTIPQHVFISFSQRDREIAVDVGRKLQADNIPVWIASADLSPGTPDWEAAVREAIKECGASGFLVG